MPTARILKAVPANRLPGDPAYRLLAPATDINGRRWPAGTEFIPLHAGTARDGRAEQVISVPGAVVTFRAPQ